MARIQYWIVELLMEFGRSQEMLCDKRQVDCMAFAVVRGKNRINLSSRVSNQANEG